MSGHGCCSSTWIECQFLCCFCIFNGAIDVEKHILYRPIKALLKPEFLLIPNWFIKYRDRSILSNPCQCFLSCFLVVFFLVIWTETMGQYSLHFPEWFTNIWLCCFTTFTANSKENKQYTLETRTHRHGQKQTKTGISQLLL